MTPRGIRNNNPLNIRKGNNWKGERHLQTDKEFEEFETIEDGCRAACILAVNLIEGRARSSRRAPCRTLHDLIYRWAPPSENSTLDYLLRVVQLTHYVPNQSLYPATSSVVCKILWAMAQVECGREIPLQKFLDGWRRAFPSRA